MAAHSANDATTSIGPNCWTLRELSRQLDGLRAATAPEHNNVVSIPGVGAGGERRIVTSRRTPIRGQPTRRNQVMGSAGLGRGLLAWLDTSYVLVGHPACATARFAILLTKRRRDARHPTRCALVFGMAPTFSVAQP
jgi:hypothetical protein